MKKADVPRTIKFHCIGVWLLTFLLALGCGYYFNKNIEKEEQLKASYTAELTVNRVQAQLHRYLEVSDFLKNIIESGYDIRGEEFTTWAKRIPNNSKVIKAIELAKGGVVTEIYPLAENKDAMGIDMLTHPARRVEANLAKQSGQYTIAGPYPLAQGGMGALLFDPIYTQDEFGRQQFWGFSILVIDWNKFVEEIGLEKLSDASFAYRLWKADGNSGAQLIMAQSKGEMPKQALQLDCAVPNNIWYFAIAPQQGWLSGLQIFITVLSAFLLACLATIIYYQTKLKRYKELLYAEEIQRAAEEAQLANAAKTRFLFNMSHDIRTPMNAIIGFAHLLGNNLGDAVKCKDYLEKIKASSNVLLMIINQVLEMARIESGKTTLNETAMSITKTVTSLNTVFEAGIHEKNLTYNCQLNVENDYVWADKTKFEEILLNVVGNAVKYTEQGGKITLAIDEQGVTAEGKIKYAITVEDNGIGMDKDYLPHIFEEFSREHTSTETKVVGTGLGLPIVKSLVELMGGTINVTSELGIGTKFVMKLAFVAAEKQAEVVADEGAAETLTNMAGKRLLLAEDNALNAEIAGVILSEAGFEVQHVADGLQCVEKIKQMPEHYYDAILMDVQMPHMNGYEATKTIRKLEGSKAAIPIIAMTANVYDEDKQRAFASGMDGFIAKPLNIKEMQKVLSAQLYRA